MSTEGKSQSREFVASRFNKVLDGLRSNNVEVVISHHGELTSDMVNSLAYELEKKLREGDAKKGVTKRMFSIIIEALQNIRLHAEKDTTGLRDSFVIVGKSEDEYIIWTANLVADAAREKIEGRLEKINGYDRVALKEYYMETLTDGEISSKGGAGLGFITIAIKSKNMLGYNFHTLSDNLHYFGMESRISLN